MVEKICRYSGVAFTATRTTETTHPKLRPVLRQAREAGIISVVEKRFAFARKLGVADIDVVVRFALHGRAEDLLLTHQIVRAPDGSVRAQALSAAPQQSVSSASSERSKRIYEEHAALIEMLRKYEAFQVVRLETRRTWQRLKQVWHEVEAEIERSRQLCAGLAEQRACDSCSKARAVPKGAGGSV